MKTYLKNILVLFISLHSLISYAITTTTAKPIVVETLGKGKPVLYFPGFTTPGTIWKETVKNLDLQRKSYLFSYAGFNGNAPIKMPWYASIKTAIINYIKEQKLSDAIIIGHSMGGNLAVDIAAELPNSISKIIIVDALPCMREVMMPNVPVTSLQYDSPYNKQMLNMNAQQFKNLANMMAANMTNINDKKEVLAKWILEADRTTWVYGYTDLLKLDLRDTLTKVNCKTLILGASFPNVSIAQKNYEKQYQQLAHKTIKMATDSKHFIMFDQPEWLCKAIKHFLAN